MSDVLLDTCAAISLVDGRPMSRLAQQAILAAGLDDGIFVSPVTGWEIGLLARPGRRRNVDILPDAWTWMRRLLGGAGVRPAPFDMGIAVASTALPEPFHADPGDRFLVATARHLDIPLVTADRRILAYAEAGHVRAVAM